MFCTKHYFYNIYCLLRIQYSCIIDININYKGVIRLKNIAIIDSGMGGLAVLARLAGALPSRYHYFADNAYMPYGNRNRQQLLDRGTYLVDRAIEEGVDTIVFACNTLSVATLARLRYKYPDITIYGCEPPIGQALQYTASQSLLVATPYVVDSTIFSPSLLKVALPQLATMIEQGASNSDMYRYIENMLAGVPYFDSIVLGCTHYSHIKDIFHQLYPAVKVFDSVDGLVAHIKKRNKRHKDILSSTIDIHLTANDEQLYQNYQQKIQQFFKYY